MENAVIDDDDAWSDTSDDSILGLLQKRCVYVPQGAGGIYTFPQVLPIHLDITPHMSSTIAISGCMTCLGVYIPIDDTRCFIAHIDGSIYHPGDRKIVDWQIPQSLHNSFQNPTVGGQTGPASLAIDVICKYFHLDKAKVLEKCGINHGFIIDHSDKTPRGLTPLGWTCPGPSPQVLNQIAVLANHCDKPEWGQNFKSILHATYEYVMPDTLGWYARRLRGDEENKPYWIEYGQKGPMWVCDP